MESDWSYQKVASHGITPSAFYPTLQSINWSAIKPFINPIGIGLPYSLHGSPKPLSLHGYHNVSQSPRDHLIVVAHSGLSIRPLVLTMQSSRLAPNNWSAAILVTSTSATIFFLETSSKLVIISLCCPGIGIQREDSTFGVQYVAPYQVRWTDITGSHSFLKFPMSWLQMSHFGTPTLLTS